MTEDHAAQPSPSRTWAGIVDRPTFERFANAWQLHAEADEPSAVTRTSTWLRTSIPSTA